MDSDAVWKLCFDGRASHGFWPSRAGSVRTRATLWDLPAVGGPLPVRSHLCWWRGECGAWAAGLRLSRSGRSAQHGVIADSAAVAAAHNSMSAAPTCCDIIALSRSKARPRGCSSVVSCSVTRRSAIGRRSSLRSYLTNSGSGVIGTGPLPYRTYSLRRRRRYARHHQAGESMSPQD